MNIDNLEIPDEWCSILSQLQVVEPDAILAGGSLRDLYHGVKPKDLDFFCRVFDGYVDLGMRESDTFDYEGMQYILAVQTYRKFSLPVNLIFIVDTPTKTLLESFDLGICQIGFDGKQLIKTDAFEWDSKHSIITMRHIDRYRRSIQRYCRINQRYNFELTIPELDELNQKVKV
ncbi:MAG: hypothetical protein KGL39_43575 [Patescibacteria group bacterium]|nr:hypothetical protein [Patescibacteria group bacterium]